MKKIALGIVLGVGLLVIAGCGSKNADTPANTQKTKVDQKAKKQMNNAGDSQASETLPPATGKVDDTVDAIIDGADKESAQATSTDSDAKSAVDDGSDTTNLNNVYDQNAL